MRTKNVYLKMGNKVFIENEFIQKFKTFNDAWTFAQQLSQVLEMGGVDSMVLVQGGTWLTDETESKPKFDLNDIPF